MGRPNKTDEKLMVSILDRYYAEVVCGDAANIRFTDLAKYAEQQGVTVREYEFRRNSAVRSRLEELKSLSQPDTEVADILLYKSLDVEGMIRSCRDLSDLKKKLYDMDAYWKSVYNRHTKMESRYRGVVAEKADAEKSAAEMKQEVQRMESLYQATESENQELRKENAYLRKMMEKYLYPDLARQLMKESHLPVRPGKNVTKAALAEMIEGKQPSAFGGIQKAKEKPKSREERLLEEMRKQVEE